MKNLGFIYNKHFFSFLNISLNGKKDANDNNKKKYQFYPPPTEKGDNKTVLSSFGKFEQEFLNVKQSEVAYKPLTIRDDVLSFKLSTVYPGLLLGSGYSHEIGENKDEFQLGFFFDHTSGLPVIPASSIKGVLRYACEVNKGEYIKTVLKDLGLETKVSLSYFEAIITEDKKGKKVVNPSEFVYNTFEGKLLKKVENEQIKYDEQGKPITKQNISIYKRDIFLDAFPTHSNGNLFGSDYITPHKNPLKDPIPIKFLRVQPEVTYTFTFILQDSNGLTAEQKKKVFEQIIKDFGLGAKTNVGYGQFKELSQKQKNEQKQQNYVRSYAPYTPSDRPKEYNENDVVEMTIIDINETDMAFEDETGSIFSKTVVAINKKFEKDLNKRRKKNTAVKFVELHKGITVKIRFNDNLSEKLSFTVLPIIK